MQELKPVHPLQKYKLYLQTSSASMSIEIEKEQKPLVN